MGAFISAHIVRHHAAPLVYWSAAPNNVIKLQSQTHCHAHRIRFTTFNQFLLFSSPYNKELSIMGLFGRRRNQQYAQQAHEAAMSQGQGFGMPEGYDQLGAEGSSQLPPQYAQQHMGAYGQPAVGGSACGSRGGCGSQLPEGYEAYATQAASAAQMPQGYQQPSLYGSSSAYDMGSSYDQAAMIDPTLAAAHGPSPLYADRYACLLYTSPSPRDKRQSRMPSSA